MKRSFAMVLLVAMSILLLFPVAGFSEEQIDPAVSILLVGDEFEARAYADEMEKRFGVTILIGAECLDIVHPSTCTIGEHAPARSPFLEMMGIKDTVTELKKLEMALERYPLEVFQSLRDENAPYGLRFLIADQLIENDPSRNTTGCFICEDSYYNVVLPHTFFDDNIVFHEIWHAMEKSITTMLPGCFLIWDALNPPGFQYSDDFFSSDDMFVYDKNYFARGYGTIAANEDRATIAEAAFFENKNEWFSMRPGVKRKLDAMNLVLKDTLKIQFNVRLVEINNDD